MNITSSRSDGIVLSARREILKHLLLIITYSFFFTYGIAIFNYEQSPLPERKVWRELFSERVLDTYPLYSGRDSHMILISRRKLPRAKDSKNRSSGRRFLAVQRWQQLCSNLQMRHSTYYSSYHRGTPCVDIQQLWRQRGHMPIVLNLW